MPITFRKTARRKQMLRRAQAPHQNDSETGQALVEAALVFIVVLLMLGGLVEFGWAYFHYLALHDAAGEGAAYGSMFSTWHYGDADADPSDPNYNPDPNNVAYRVRNESETDLLDWSAAAVDVEAPFTTPGNQITVTVIYDHQLITPFLTGFTDDGSITLRARAVQTILSPPPSP